MDDATITSEGPIDDSLTEDQIAQIEEGMADIEAGRGIPHAKLVARIAERRRVREDDTT